METSHFWVYVTENLSQSTNIAVLQQRLLFVRVLRKNITCRRSCWCYFCFYPCSSEGVLSYYISTWYANSSAGRQESPSEDHKLYTENHWLHTLSSSCYLSRAADIMKDPSHLGHYLFNLLPSGR